ncbi:PucR family transcriptional regulator [Thalassobacillus pellis]|uniref:PucR family transcriptional regulator n=1 Tax=Thalassobacillus pellis TaxID=748008 RepID=UPI00195F82C7|nr:helix-turn-helix domain-containing protein [Thalassobacillus pellis]MBM7551116.1 DNA-binding PucR family transcriptional regulator [Thalassobacillus pellis]
MAIIEKLKELYPSLIERKKEQEIPKNHAWFLTSDDEIIGIDRDELDGQEADMLGIFLTPYHWEKPENTEREQQWADLLFHEKLDNRLLENPPIQYRFVFFIISENPMESESFQEAVQGLFPTAMPLIWEDENTGFIIEEADENFEESHSYEQIIDVLMSDFYVKLSFFVSDFFTDIKQAPAHFNWSRQCSQVAQKHLKLSVADHLDVIPFLFLDKLSDRTSENIIEAILKDAKDDHELLKTIQVFLECNSNATLTSKQLYMHRNSLQYRVDKFIEKTGIDVRQFKEGMLVYLAMLLQDKN